MMLQEGDTKTNDRPTTGLVCVHVRAAPDMIDGVDGRTDGRMEECSYAAWDKARFNTQFYEFLY